MLIWKFIYNFEKINKSVIWISIKLKTIPINFNKVLLKLEFLKICIASLAVDSFG